jgi:pilus assembly protein Flp/PilA
MLGLLRALARDKRGATAVEYGLIVALIFIAIIVAVSNAAGSTVNMWNNVATRVVNT